MECFFCKKELFEDEVEIDIIPQDSAGNAIGDMKKIYVCDWCCMTKMLGVPEDEAREALGE